MKQDNRDKSRNWQTTNTGGTNYVGEIHFHRNEPNSPLTQQEYRNRQALLAKVKNFWIKGVLEKSLYNQVLIELGFEERFDALNSSWNLELETVGEGQESLPEGTKVISIFDQLGEGRTLLILGEPGAGKTTTLLELTRDLITRAEMSPDYRIPVVLNLSSWLGKRQTIGDWLVEELNSKYQVPKEIGKDWVKKQELLLLLDGLDEVKAEHRESCVAALNDFHQNYAPEMVVCSRLQDYSALSNRLNFQSAVYLRSLTPEQARHYLDSLRADLRGLRALIEGDTALQELAKSPLMLNIMVLAYEGVALENLPKTEVVEERRKQLFDAYIERMFRHPTRFKLKQRYSKAQTKRWLAWLAQRMVQESQTVFFIERMQPMWLQTNGRRILYRLGSFVIGGLISGLIFELINLLMFGLFRELMFESFHALMFGSFRGLFIGMCFWLIAAWGKAEIKTVETLKWSWKKVKNGLIGGLIFGLIFGLIITVTQVSGSAFFGLTGVLSFWLISGMKGSVIATKTIPNQGIYRTARNAGIMGLIIGLMFGLMFGLMSGLMSGLSEGLMLGLMYGLMYGLIALILGGGYACFQHFSLRLILYRDGYIAWNYARFLDYASDHIFLQKVGGGYIFIHRLLLEHFAQMSVER
jgi:DNA polymerase III delta prime subunit